jgi:hypothetical protein
MTVDMRTYERSTHDLGYIWRSTMSAGTLVPFMSEIGLPGDTFDIDLEANIMTHPTVGPLFGSYKVQLDIFEVPVRLYNGDLHNNTLGIGLDMSKVKLPQIELEANNINYNKAVDNQQINPSCIFKYLGISGLGSQNGTGTTVKRRFNAIPYLGYWDIYKNYYANKQEEVGAVIHTDTLTIKKVITSVVASNDGYVTDITIPKDGGDAGLLIIDKTVVSLLFSGAVKPEASQIKLSINGGTLRNALDIFQKVTVGTTAIDLSDPTSSFYDNEISYWSYEKEEELLNSNPQVNFFPLSNIDDARNVILRNTGLPNPVIIGKEGEHEINFAPYSYPCDVEEGIYFKEASQEGLGLKTYQSDLFNNWMSTEWIDGENGINAITAIDTSDGSFTVDTLQLSKKVYDMLNRIAISGGSYDDWLDAVYTHERIRSAETPVYQGGLIKELVFQEVISSSGTSGEAGFDNNQQPLGTLAGKGILDKKHKGGKVTVKCNEPCFIMGIVSLTPRIDYSQGNKFNVNLETMNDFHKPALDEIGFQDLVTDQMAWWDTSINGSTKTFSSAGKQPAWLNYMTNVNKCYGNFAVEDNEMFMTLNRRYEINEAGKIKDLTTYIDPAKFNNIFAQTSRDAQNFWVQIGVDITARRKMSAKLMPNL